jgi:hypothetical protein
MSTIHSQDHEDPTTDLLDEPEAKPDTPLAARMARKLGRATRRVRDGGAFVAESAATATKETGRAAQRLFTRLGPTSRRQRMEKAAYTAIEDLRQQLLATSDDESLLGTPQFWRLIATLHGVRALRKSRSALDSNPDAIGTDEPAPSVRE